MKLPAQDELMAINATSASTLMFLSWREMDGERKCVELKHKRKNGE